MSTDEVPRDARRSVPRTDVVLDHPLVAEQVARVGRARVKAEIGRAQEEVRGGALAAGALVTTVLDRLPTGASSLRPVVNATGVVLHTNLGRAALSAAAVEALVAASGPTDVELDLTTGRRASRGRSALAALLRAVPDAAAAHVVTNGAAALLLAATALAQGRDIVVSRGELVEIGDGFRLPDLLTSTGARLREVGTTNRTTLDDYRAAVGADTAFVLKVHPSNFVVTGFTSTAKVRDLATLGVPVVVDIGSGLLAPEPLLPDEPDAATALRAGADLVTASGDKLLGGPQAGLLLGRTDLVERLRRHPAARALRVDKLTLAALEATVSLPTNPTRAALHADAAALHRRSTALAEQLQRHGVAAAVVESHGVVGGGGAPDVELAGWAVSLAQHLAMPLRTGDPAVLGRVERQRLLLDLRCVPADLDDDVAEAVRRAAKV